MASIEQRITAVEEFMDSIAVLDASPNTIDDIARKMWESDCDHDPMLHTSWAASKGDYRRRTALVVYWLLTAADRRCS